MDFGTDPYSAPEKHGLEMLGQLDLAEPDYSFDMVAVWRDPTGSMFYAFDSGCSCPSPFEDTTVKDLSPLTDYSAFQREVVEMARSHAESDDFKAGLVELMSKVTR